MRVQVRTATVRTCTRWAIMGEMKAGTLDIDTVLDDVRNSPTDIGTIHLIAVRPADGERLVVDEAKVSAESGLDGDNWLGRNAGSDPVPDHNQITLMNSRFADAITPEGQGWELAGDQLYADFDISVENTPPGTVLQIGTATVRISAEPHTGCAKFASRFGREILKMTQTDLGKALRLRGVNASVLEAGSVATGDSVSRVGFHD